MAAIEHRAREVALRHGRGLDGTAVRSFKLADALGIEVVARQDLDDARLVASVAAAYRVQPTTAARTHPILDRPRNRTLVVRRLRGAARYRDLDQRRADDWQLEVLCNIAAAEFLMPPGAFPIRATEDLNVVSLLDQRSNRGVDRSVVAPSGSANGTASCALCRSPG